MHMGQEDAAGLQDCKKLGCSMVWKRGKELVLTFGHLQLEHSRIVHLLSLQTGQAAPGFIAVPC
jgi:hypothetical protein